MSDYGISKKVDLDYDKAVSKVRESLSTEGFGVLTEIDVKATLKQKLDKDFKRYVILGACNPPYAYKALTSENNIGLLLPCNVIVYENDDGGSTVSVIDPIVAMNMVDNPVLAGIAKEVRQKLINVIDLI
ncbi:MAG: DUF302 domain-containing protein [Deltaproteobacteria bacterium]|nr:DUF302 domain-containing protein [Deltaproteobacteria bacterium]